MSKTGTRFSLQDKRIFEIMEVEIMRVDCMSIKPVVQMLTEVQESGNDSVRE